MFLNKIVQTPTPTRPKLSITKAKHYRTPACLDIILDKNSYSHIDVDENIYLHNIMCVYQALFQIRKQSMPAKFNSVQRTLHISPKVVTWTYSF